MLDPHFRTLIAPYGTNLLHVDDAYVRQLDALDVDIIAYQDEVGVRKSTPEQTGGYFAAHTTAPVAVRCGRTWKCFPLRARFTARR